MKLLLDTHTYLWLRVHPARLGGTAARAIDSDRNELFLSIVSLWEMTIKSSKQQLKLPASGIAAVAAELPLFGITLAGVTLDDIVQLEGLPHIHKDPFDRLLVAQTVRTGFTIVTDDALLRRYDVPVLWG